MRANLKRLVKQIVLRIAETMRLMVGVGDYDRYLEHVRLHHPELAPLSRSDFFRHCQNARYPSGDGQIKRCPC